MMFDKVAALCEPSNNVSANVKQSEQQREEKKKMKISISNDIFFIVDLFANQRQIFPSAAFVTSDKFSTQLGVTRANFPDNLKSMFNICLVWFLISIRFYFALHSV